MATLNHGTERGYKGGCRCDLCTHAHAKASREYRERRREREGKSSSEPRVPTPLETVPTNRVDVPAQVVISSARDGLTRLIEDALFEGRGVIGAAAIAAASIRDAGYRLATDGPIEAAARRALADAGGDDNVATLRRETVFRAAAVMDNQNAVPFFKSAADVLRVTLADLLAAQPEKNGETDAIRDFMASLGSSRGRRNSSSVDDSKEPSA